MENIANCKLLIFLGLQRCVQDLKKIQVSQRQEYKGNKHRNSTESENAEVIQHSTHKNYFYMKNMKSSSLKFCRDKFA